MNRTGSAFALWVLFAINAINFFDRQIGGVLAEPIRKEWGLSDTQVGWLATAFTLLYAAMGVPLGGWPIARTGRGCWRRACFSGAC